MKKVGIIGGLGPLAGAHFYRRVIELSPATSDEGHLPVILVSDPTIPSRIKHLMGAGESPAPQLQQVARNLVLLGAELLVIPSSTTNLYYGEVCQSVEVPVVSLVEEVTQVIDRSGSRKVGLLGTTPTLTFRLYDQALESVGTTVVRPDDASQQDVMDIIATVKGDSPKSDIAVGDRILEIAHRPWARELDGLLLACTEIPVIFPVDNWHRDVRLFNTTDILAKATVRDAYRKD